MEVTWERSAGEYLDLSERKFQMNGENCVVYTKTFDVSYERGH